MKKPEYLTSAGVVQGIRISEKGGVLNIVLPCLVPKRKGRKSSEFLTDPLYFSLNQYADSHRLPKFRHCVVCFSHIYSQDFPLSRVRDYDNLEFKQILDTLCTYVLTDDSGFFCDSYYTTQLGLKDCTLVSVMEKADFPKWLQNQKNHHESMSENLLTSQAEIRHR